MKINYVIFFIVRDSEIVAKFLPVVLNLPSTCHVAVKHSSVKLVGELAEWIHKHPECLGKYHVHILSQQSFSQNMIVSDK